MENPWVAMVKTGWWDNPGKSVPQIHPKYDAPTSGKVTFKELLKTTILRMRIPRPEMIEMAWKGGLMQVEKCFIQSIHIGIHTYIPYHTIPYHTIPYHTIPYHYITSHHITSHHITLHNIHTYIHIYIYIHTYISISIYIYYTHPAQIFSDSPFQPFSIWWELAIPPWRWWKSSGSIWAKWLGTQGFAPRVGYRSWSKSSGWSVSIIFHHFPSFSIIFHHFPSFSIIFHHFPSFSIIFHHFPSFSIIFHHFPSFSIIFHHFPSFSIIFLIHPMAVLKLTTLFLRMEARSDKWPDQMFCIVSSCFVAWFVSLQQIASQAPRHPMEMGRRTDNGQFPDGFWQWKHQMEAPTEPVGLPRNWPISMIFRMYQWYLSMMYLYQWCIRSPLSSVLICFAYGRALFFHAQLGHLGTRSCKRMRMDMVVSWNPPTPLWRWRRAYWGANSYTKCSIIFVNIAVAISALAGGGQKRFRTKTSYWWCLRVFSTIFGCLSLRGHGNGILGHFGRLPAREKRTEMKKHCK